MFKLNSSFSLCEFAVGIFLSSGLLFHGVYVLGSFVSRCPLSMLCPMLSLEEFYILLTTGQGSTPMCPCFYM